MDAARIRKDFPALGQTRRGRPLVYLDSACVTLRPRQVIDKVAEYYSEYPGCHGRVSHLFGRRTTEEYGAVRKKVRRFVNARSDGEVIFTRNTTEGINIVASGLSFRPGQQILGSEMEHNSNLTPWQIASSQKGVKRTCFPLTDELTFDEQAFQDVMSGEVRIVAVHHVSNLTGAEMPVRRICRIAHDFGALVLVDGAQAVPHMDVDVRRLGADFYCFSGHKMLGPSGTGVLYGRRELLDELPQLITGGETVADTTLKGHTLAGLPDRFEAGLQNYAGIIGFGAAIDYLRKIDRTKLARHEAKLNSMVTDALREERSARILGPEEPAERPSMVNVVLEGRNPHDVARILDEASNIMLRAGKHCVHSWYNSTATPDSLRASFYCYNTVEDAEIFVDSLRKVLSS